MVRAQRPDIGKASDTIFHNFTVSQRERAPGGDSKSRSRESKITEIVVFVKIVCILDILMPVRQRLSLGVQKKYLNVC